jgi:hypothetical protein
MTVELSVATYAFTVQRKIAADALEFRMSDKGWRESICLIQGPSPVEIRCGVLSEICAPDLMRLPARVFGPDGDLRGEWSVTGVDTQTAQGADAFLYFENEAGFWEGVTLAFDRSRLAIHEFEIDPL